MILVVRFDNNAVKLQQLKTDEADASHIDPALTIEPDTTRRRPLMPHSITPCESDKSQQHPLTQSGVR